MEALAIGHLSDVRYVHLNVHLMVSFCQAVRQRAQNGKTDNKLGHHLVAFLDVLGQRDRLRGLKKPANAQEEDEVKEVLRQTAGFVVELRTVFQNQFEAFEAGTPSMQRHTKEPLRPSFTGFSDSFVTSVPLREEGHELVPHCDRVFSPISGLRRHANRTCQQTSFAGRN